MEVYIMSQQINVNIRMDKDIKERADALFSNLGFNLTTAVNTFVKQSLREQAIPFQPRIMRNHITLKERLKNFDGQYDFEEWDTGVAVGSEIIE